MKLCKLHIKDFSEIVECNECNCLVGYVLSNKYRGVFLMDKFPNFWNDKESAIKFARKYSIYREYKPIKVFIHFE